MPGNLPTKLLTWKEPRTVRAAVRDAAIRRMGLRGYLRRRLRHAAFFASGFLILVLIPLLAGRNVLPWYGIVALPTFCGILLTYFVAVVVRLMPQEVRVTDRGVQQQAGPGWRIFPWGGIARIELTEALLDGRRCRLMLLHPADSSGANDGDPSLPRDRDGIAPSRRAVAIGVADRIDAGKLQAVLSEQGAAVRHRDAQTSAALADFAPRDDDDASSAVRWTWIVDAAMILLLVLAAAATYAALPVAGAPPA